MDKGAWWATVTESGTADSTAGIACAIRSYMVRKNWYSSLKWMLPITAMLDKVV